jgi:hypothetical protein
MKKYYVETVDNVIAQDLQVKVWDYVQDQTYYASRKVFPFPHTIATIKYIPNQDKKEYLDESLPNYNNQFMHRCSFAVEEADLQKHPVIQELWNNINKNFNNKFEITGYPEGRFWSEGSLYTEGFVNSRAYVNVQPIETINRTHGIRRDTVDLTDDKSYTMLYIANPEWYPSWFAETLFYADDNNANDRQQFQKGFGQSKDFGIGDSFLTVCPKPGRIILWDGRTLHTTKPAAVWANQMRYAVAFRLREK